MCRVSTHMRLRVLTLDPPTVIPGEHHLTRDEGLVPLTGLGEHHSALLLSDCCSLLLWHCGVVHCQCGSPPGCPCSRGERHSGGYHSYICARRGADRIVGVRDKYIKWGPYYRLGGWGHAPRNFFAILHALKCVLGASEAPFRAYIQYTHTCQLLSSFRGFRSKSATYGALVSGCAVVKCAIFEVSVSSVSAKPKSRLT